MVHNNLVRVLEEAWQAGSPIAGRSDKERGEMARVAARRINSFPRRKVSAQDRAHQVRDLARGLVAKFEKNPELVGRLIQDYRHLAELLLDAQVGHNEE